MTPMPANTVSAATTGTAALSPRAADASRRDLNVDIASAFIRMTVPAMATTATPTEMTHVSLVTNIRPSAAPVRTRSSGRFDSTYRANAATAAKVKQTRSASWMK